MTICTSCGAENADGVRFCVKCGTALATAPQPGSWQQPSGDLSSTPGGWPSAPSEPSGSQQPSGGFGSPSSYTPPAAPMTPSYGYGQPATTGPGGRPYAEWADRALAAVIDGALVAGVMLVLYFIFGALIAGAAAVGGSQDNPLAGGLCCIMLIIVPVAMLLVGLYNKVYLITKRGFSIGQGVMKLKVVDGAGNLLQTGTAVLRLLVQMGLAIIPFVGWILVLVDLLFPLWDEKKQTIHDKAVSSFVIKQG